jgi:hypothetical protein
MRTTQKGRPRFDLLHPASIAVFFALVVLWIVVATAPDWEGFTPRAVARLAGYGAFIAMLVPYLHILRRCFRYRRGGAMTFWLRLHIGASYLAFGLVLIHSRGRANGALTLGLVWLVWLVMLSGVVGYYGQKLLYVLLPMIVERELGMERLGAERDALLAAADDLNKKKEIQQAPEVIRLFCEAAVRDCLAPAYSVFGWLRPAKGQAVLSRNSFERACSFGDPKQQEIVTRIWSFVEMRRAMDLEYRLHQLGRSWLLLHGPAAWALFVLMVEHAAMSIWYGGF